MAPKKPPSTSASAPAEPKGKDDAETGIPPVELNTNPGFFKSTSIFWIGIIMIIGQALLDMIVGYAIACRVYTQGNTALFDKNIIKDVNLKALAGLNLRKSYARSIFAATNGGLIVPGLYSVANSKGTVAAPSESFTPREVFGVFAGVTLSYKNFLNFDGTIRQDQSSTLPVDANKYLYYSGAASWNFSEHFTDLPWLTSGKLRVNYATVGNDAPWGAIKNVYDQPAPFGSTILFSAP
jgi:hypothetical protein